MNRRQSGFTLIEVMIALTIMSLIMVALYKVLDSSLRIGDVLEHEVRASSAGPTALDLIERDLRRAWVLNLQDDKIFRGEDRTLLGEPADSLVFLSTSGSSTTRRVGDHEVGAELCETGYRLRINPELPDVLELWRRQDYHVDDEPLRDGSYELVNDRVIGFDVQYYEDHVLEHEPLDEWDAEERHALPAMIAIHLGLEVGPRIAQEDRRSGDLPNPIRWYDRVIMLDASRDLAMRVHPYPPSLSGATGGSGGAGAGANGEGEGKGNDGGQPDDFPGDGNPVDDDGGIPWDQLFPPGG